MLLGRDCKPNYTRSTISGWRKPLIEVNAVEYVQVPVGTSIADMERAMIMATLKRCGGNKTRTAAMLGVSLKTLYNRLNAYRALDMADLPGER